jgi:hypothetical protein
MVSFTITASKRGINIIHQRANVFEYSDIILMVTPGASVESKSTSAPEERGF